MRTRIFQLHKRSSYVFSAIQDKICFDNRKQIYAISDGATQGYKSEIWSEKLVKSFVDKPNFEVNSLLQDFKNYAESFQKIPNTENSNPALRALEERKRMQGGFATFMGVKIEGGELEYISSGDVCGFVKSNDILQGFPFSKVEELDQDKGFLGTQKVINGENKAEQFRQGKISLKKGDRVILMTDTIARLTLRDKSILDRILSFRNYEDFFQFITKEWENKRLEEDDITIGIIEVSDDIQEEVYLPSSNFSFPKEERPIIQFNQFNTDKMSLEEIKKHLQILDKKVKSLEEEKQKLYNKIEQKSFAIRIFNFILVVVLLTTYHYLFNGKENEVKSVNKTSEVVNKKGSEKNVQKKDKNKSNQKNDENSSSKNESIIEEKTQKVSDTREVKKDEVKPKDDNKETIQKNEKNNDIKKD
jgi:hypothetical protein